MATPGQPNVFFVFGPAHSFIAYLPGIYSTSSNFSSEIARILATDNVKAINFVAFPGYTGDAQAKDGVEIFEAYIGYHKKHGLKTSGQLYTPLNKTLALNGLDDWIKAQDKKSEGVEVVCNSTGGYWARVGQGDKTKVFHCGLTNETKQWLKKTNPHGACATCVALGVDDSYIIVYEDKHVVWDLKGRYEELDKRLTQVLATPNTLFYVALNPYHADEYFCQFDDWSCSFNFAGTADFKQLEKLILDSDLRVIIDSETLKQSTDAVQAVTATTEKAKDGFAVTVFQKALTDVAEKNLEGNLTSMMGAL
ncbi:hypothetical protein V8E51_018251 [Hyaloscypha variabilis]